MEIYYESQSDWGENEYYYLHRVLHRMFFYYEKYSDEILKMDPARMSEQTKVLIYCVIRYYHNEFLFEKYSNLSDIRTVAPLEQPLVLESIPLREHTVYEDMNVVI